MYSTLVYIYSVERNPPISSHTYTNTGMVVCTRGSAEWVCPKSSAWRSTVLSCVGAPPYMGFLMQNFQRFYVELSYFLYTLHSKCHNHIISKLGNQVKVVSKLQYWRLELLHWHHQGYTLPRQFNRHHQPYTVISGDALPCPGPLK